MDLLPSWLPWYIYQGSVDENLDVRGYRYTYLYPSAIDFKPLTFSRLTLISLNNMLSANGKIWINSEISVHFTFYVSFNVC